MEQSTQSDDVRTDKGRHPRYRGRNIRNDSYHVRPSGHHVQNSNQRHFNSGRRGYRARSSRQHEQVAPETEKAQRKDETCGQSESNSAEATTAQQEVSKSRDEEEVEHEQQDDAEKVACDNDEDLSNDDSIEKECPLCLEELDIVESQFYPCSSCKFQICLFCLHRLREECMSGESESTIHSCPGCRNAYPNYADDEAVFMELSKKIKSKAVHTNGSLNNAHNQANGQSVNSKSGGDKTVKSSVKSTNGNRYSNLTVEIGETGSPATHVKKGHVKKSDELDQNVSERTNEHHRRHKNYNVKKRSNTKGSETNEKPPNDYSNASRRGRKNMHIVPEGERGKTNVANTNTRKQSSGPLAGLNDDTDDGLLLDSEPGKKKDLVDLLSNIGLDPSRIHFHRKQHEPINN